MKGLFLFFSLVALIVLEIMIASKIIVRVEEKEDNNTEKIDPLEKLDREIEEYEREERELKRRLEEGKKEPERPKVYSCWCPGTTFDTYKIAPDGRIYPVDDD